MTPLVKGPLMEMHVVCSCGFFVFHCHSTLLTEVSRAGGTYKHPLQRVCACYVWKGGEEENVSLLNNGVYFVFSGRVFH